MTRKTRLIPPCTVDLVTDFPFVPVVNDICPLLRISWICTTTTIATISTTTTTITTTTTTTTSTLSPARSWAPGSVHPPNVPVPAISGRRQDTRIGTCNASEGVVLSLPGRSWKTELRCRRWWSLRRPWITCCRIPCSPGLVSLSLPSPDVPATDDHAGLVHVEPEGVRVAAVVNQIR